MKGADWLANRRFLSLRFPPACSFVPSGSLRPGGPKDNSPRREPWDLMALKFAQAPAGAKEGRLGALAWAQAIASGRARVQTRQSGNLLHPPEDLKRGGPRRHLSVPY